MGHCQWFSMGYFNPLWIHARPSGRVMVSLSWNLRVQRKNKGSMTRRRARMPTLVIIDWKTHDFSSFSTCFSTIGHVVCCQYGHLEGRHVARTVYVSTIDSFDNRWRHYWMCRPKFLLSRSRSQSLYVACFMSLVMVGDWQRDSWCILVSSNRVSM